MPGTQQRSRLVLETAAKVVAISRRELIQGTLPPQGAPARRPVPDEAMPLLAAASIAAAGLAPPAWLTGARSRSPG